MWCKVRKIQSGIRVMFEGAGGGGSYHGDEERICDGNAVRDQGNEGWGQGEWNEVKGLHS